MILDAIPRINHYVSLHPLFLTAFDYLRASARSLPVGKHAIDGDRLFAIVQEYTTAPAAEKRFETHRRYLDIQYMVSGEEVALHSPSERLQVSVPYDEGKDAIFYADPEASSSSLLRWNDFAIYFPQDAHKVGCQIRGPGAVRKVVVKVAL